MNRNVVIGIVKDWGLALLIVLGVLGVWNLVAGPAAPTIPSGAPAPDFTLSDLDGNVVTLSERQGQVVVLNFWATWCPPCKKEIPAFSAFHGKHPEVPLYGISVDDRIDSKRLAAEAKRLGVTYPVLHDAMSRVGNAYGVNGLPTTVVIGADGSIQGVHVGPLTQRGLEKMVTR